MCLCVCKYIHIHAADAVFSSFLSFMHVYVMVNKK